MRSTTDARQSRISDSMSHRRGRKPPNHAAFNIPAFAVPWQCGPCRRVTARLAASPQEEQAEFDRSQECEKLWARFTWYGELTVGGVGRVTRRRSRCWHSRPSPSLLSLYSAQRLLETALQTSLSPLFLLRYFCGLQTVNVVTASPFACFFYKHRGLLDFNP